MLVSWGVDASFEVETVDDLDRLLDTLDAECAGHGMIVQLTHPCGATLAVGLGHNESVLTYFDETGGSFSSVGDRNRDDYLAFEFGGDISEMMGAKAVPTIIARSVVRDFFEQGTRSAAIEWEKEWA